MRLSTQPAEFIRSVDRFTIRVEPVRVPPFARPGTDGFAEVVTVVHAGVCDDGGEGDGGDGSDEAAESDDGYEGV